MEIVINIICPNCSHRFLLGNRYLYAENLDKLNILLDYFIENKKLYENPEMDFPKIFYSKRIEIVNKIEKIIKEEIIGNS